MCEFEKCHEEGVYIGQYIVKYLYNLQLTNRFNNSNLILTFNIKIKIYLKQYINTG